MGFTVTTSNGVNKYFKQILLSFLGNKQKYQKISKAYKYQDTLFESGDECKFYYPGDTIFLNKKTSIMSLFNSGTFIVVHPSFPGPKISLGELFITLKTISEEQNSENYTITYSCSIEQPKEIEKEFINARKKENLYLSSKKISLQRKCNSISYQTNKLFLLSRDMAQL